MCHPRQSKVAARNRRKMSSKLCEIHERRLPISSSPMRSLSLMRQRVMPRLLHQSDNHPLVCEMFLIHPSCFFDDGRTPAPSCRRVLALDQSSYEMFFLLAIVLERVSESLIVLTIAREMRCWDGRLRSLWLFSPKKLLGVAESVAGGVLALCATQVVA